MTAEQARTQRQIHHDLHSRHWGIEHCSVHECRQALAAERRSRGKGKRPAKKSKGDR